MNKKIFALLLVTIILMALMPQVALAATHTLADGKGFNLDLDQFADGDIIVVEAGANAMLMGSKNVTVECGEGVALTLYNVNIDVSAADACALSFTGSGNTLTLAGASSLKSGWVEPGIRVEGGTSLEITGLNSGDSLDVTGGSMAAGIGAGSWDNVGTITIGGNAQVSATGSNGGAGIGGGNRGGGDVGTITIGGNAQVSATGSNGGAGIGGGDGSKAGTITIEGNAQVSATGGIDGVGIGGGKLANGGTINISGGIVCAIKGSNGYCDMGEGGAAHGGSKMKISDSAVVFLGTDSLSPQLTTTHKHLTVTEGTDEIVGIPVPEGWAPPFGAYIAASFLTYNANGGSDAPGQVIVLTGENAVVADDIGMSFTGYEFVRWDTKDTGDGISYDPGDSILLDADKTLYAIWREVKAEDVNITSDTEVILPVGAVTLTAVVTPDTALDKSLSWTSSDEDVATVDSQGVVTGIGMGTATIKAETSNGCFDTCQIIVSGVVMNYELSTGSVMKMSATVQPIGTTAVWTSDNESVATVAQDGTVTAIAPGFAVITATGGIALNQCGVVVYDQAVTNPFTIATPGLLAGTLGESYSCSLVASGGDSNNTWYASGLPKGLSIDRDTGKISGKPNETGDFSVYVTVCDGEGRSAEKIYTLTVGAPGGTGKYKIVPDADSAYTVGTADGFTVLTINDGVTGFRYLKVSVNPIVAHEGEETCVFVLMRDGVQIGFYATVADFDNPVKATAGFNVKPGDIIKVYIVDELSNSIGSNPVLLQ